MSYTKEDLMRIYGKGERYWSYYTSKGKLPLPELDNGNYSHEQLSQIEASISLITQHTTDDYLLSTGKVLSEVQAQQAQRVADYNKQLELERRTKAYWENQNRIQQIKEDEAREIAEKRGSSVSQPVGKLAN